MAKLQFFTDAWAHRVTYVNSKARQTGRVYRNPCIMVEWEVETSDPGFFISCLYRSGSCEISFHKPDNKVFLSDEEVNNLRNSGSPYDRVHFDDSMRHQRVYTGPKTYEWQVNYQDTRRGDWSGRRQ